MREIKIAVVGQPNVGKSMLINSLSNGKAQMHVGNFSGVTVEKLEFSYEYNNCKFTLIDLPGSYSTKEFSQEEYVTKDFLRHGDYNIILNVLDSTNLERNLFLTAELIELSKPMVVALNMIDEANAEGISINEKQLGRILGLPVFKVSALKNIGVKELSDSIIQYPLDQPVMTHLRYTPVIEEEISNLVQFFKSKHFHPPEGAHNLAIKLLSKDDETYKKLHDQPIWVELQHILNNAWEHIYIHKNSKDIEEIFDEERVAFAKGAVTETVKVSKQHQENLTERLDKILIHPILGLPIFLFFMWALFQLTFSLGAIPMEWIDAGFSFIGERLALFLGDNDISHIVVDGGLAGVGAVVMFVPNIAILFCGIALLEHSGYMSRVAFLLDGFFHKFGLHGKSFIPLVTGFGCTVPAYLAARTIKNERDRLVTLFVLGFISCSARFPIYAVFIAAFFKGHNAGNILFIIYISGALFALFAAKFLKMTVFKGEEEPFVMEMPKYRIPSFKILWHSVSLQSLSYLRKAGTFILVASLLVWIAQHYPKPPKGTPQNIALEQSYLGQIGKASQPFFAPLGFDWKMSVALETGLAAKEVVVSTLGILYKVDGDIDEKNTTFIEVLRNSIPKPAAVAFIAFVMLYLPCFAAAGVFTKEAGGYKHLFYLFIFTTATAWSVSFIVYHVTKLLT